MAVKLASFGTNLHQRLISALVLGAAAVVATALGGLPFLALILVFAGLVHWEWYQAEGQGDYLASLPVLLVVWATGILFWSREPEIALAVFSLGGVMSIGWALKGGRDVAMTALGLVCMALPVVAMLHLRLDGLAPVLFVFAVVWITDTGALAAGKMIGGAKLWPSVSPNKTWAGAIGGLVAGALAGMVTALLLGDEGVAWTLALGVGMVVSVAGQLGDLAESAWKRYHGIKDSGRMIPGHGGVMDRLDSVMAAAPTFVVIRAAGGSPL